MGENPFRIRGDSQDKEIMPDNNSRTQSRDRMLKM